METAKLVLRQTKKKKIVAELHFEDGKKMSVPNLVLPDMTLDGAKVEVERQGGRITLIKAEDKVLFSTKSTQESFPFIQSKAERSWPTSARDERVPLEPPKIKKGEPTDQDCQIDHVGHVRNPAHAPYNFVPLNRQVIENNHTIPLADIYDTNKNTGWIDIEIETLTPIYIRGTLKPEEVEAEIENKNKSDFYAPAGRLRIPGSSLRGMVRNMVEMISFGRFHFFDNKRLYYRGLADRSNLRTEYQQRMSSYDRATRRTQYNFSVGVLRKCQKHERGLHFEIKSSGSNFRQILKTEARKITEQRGYKYNEFCYYRLDRSYLVVSGNMPNKKRDWLIAFPSDDAEIIPIPDEDIRSYREDRNRDTNGLDLLEEARLSDSIEGDVPCFYVRWQDEQGNDRISFGHTGMFRLAYEKSIGEHVPIISHRVDESVLERVKDSLPKPIPEELLQLIDQEFAEKDLSTILVNMQLKEHNRKLKKNEILAILQAAAKMDFSESIFGNATTFAGRVYFEDAFLIESQKRSALGEKTPKILSMPKPTTFQHYLTQSSDEVKQLNHYNNNSAIRGYKVYWHKSDDTRHWEETDTARVENSNQYTRIQAICSGIAFHGRIRFENLSNVELGALLFALDLPYGWGHKIGMGKPLGLGSIRIKPVLYLSNRFQRYLDLFAEWDSKVTPSSDAHLKSIKYEFERYILDELTRRKLVEGDIECLWEVDRLRELMVMLNLNIGKQLEGIGALDYMTIEPRNEFKNRYVLPSPSHIASAAMVEDTLKKMRYVSKSLRMKSIESGQKSLEENCEPEDQIGEITSIKRILVKGLWDKFDIDWPIDDNVSILVGINGSGKSTILQLINYALANKYDKPGVVNYPPQEFTILFDNNEELSYERTKSGIKCRVRPKFRLLPEFISTFDAPLELEETKGDQIETTREQVEKQLTSRLWERIDRFLSEIENLRTIGIDPTPYVDYFVQLTRDEIFIRTQKEISFIGKIKFTQKCLKGFLDDNVVTAELRNKLESMVSDEAYAVDKKYLGFLESKVGKDYASRYRSHILRYAEFIQTSTPSQAIFRLDDGSVLMPDQLSTGEKQILIILLTALILKFRAIANEELRYVLIMDEPENSLHLRWQEYLFSYIRRLNQNIQIIVATHTPGIIKKGYIVNTVEMNQIKSLVES